MIAPPPWTLTGAGLVLVAHFPEAFVREQGFLAPYQQRGYRGWVGAVILADYHTSGGGPYQELLFIPGLFRFDDTLSFSISKIYVSTEDSVWNGRENWGIPKERADFSFVTQTDGSRLITISRHGRPFLSLRARPWGLRFPITTKIVPGFRIVQQRLNATSSGVMLLTRPSATGTARLASLSELRVDPAFFPDVGCIRPLIAVSLENFTMTFPVPEVL